MGLPYSFDLDENCSFIPNLIVINYILNINLMRTVDNIIYYLIIYTYTPPLL